MNYKVNRYKNENLQILQHKVENRKMNQKKMKMKRRKMMIKRKYKKDLKINKDKKKVILYKKSTLLMITLNNKQNKGYKIIN